MWSHCLVSSSKELRACSCLVLADGAVPCSSTPACWLSPSPAHGCSQHPPPPAASTATLHSMTSEFCSHLCQYAVCDLPRFHTSFIECCTKTEPGKLRQEASIPSSDHCISIGKGKALLLPSLIQQANPSQACSLLLWACYGRKSEVDISQTRMA